MEIDTDNLAKKIDQLSPEERQKVADFVEFLILKAGQSYGSEDPRKQNIRQFFGRWKDAPDAFFDCFESASQELRSKLSERFCDV
ncbi:MAG TPA: DUF2281 domain-containing protein [Candidatus Lokiarchaeia archaeon]|nr:DUF2281 domain-containing protein [Candidatus Lokiarchaeia archaeon]